MGKPPDMKYRGRCAVGYNAREPCEVKHLSSTWKINQSPTQVGVEIPSVVASESGNI